MLRYWTNDDVESLVRLAGGQASAVSYLMGNHTIMERMFRYEPAVLLYAPLYTVIWSDPGGEAFFSVDKLSDQFDRFGNPDITAAGREVDLKPSALLGHLNLGIRVGLLATWRTPAR